MVINPNSVPQSLGMPMAQPSMPISQNPQASMMKQMAVMAILRQKLAEQAQASNAGNQ
jgi:hypothetical protein